MSKRSESNRLYGAAAGVIAFCLFFATGSALAASKLSTKEARKVIARVGGSDLSSGAIHVRKISPSGAAASDVLAQVELAFNFVKESGDGWRIAEVRTGDNSWEDISLIAQAIRERSGTNVSKTQDEQQRASMGQFDVDLDARQARRSLAQLVDIELPSDALRVKELSLLSGSAIVVAEIEFEFRIVKDGKQWRVAAVRIGDNEWQDVGAIVLAVNNAKRDRAQRELEMVAEALETFRRERGFYVVAQTEAVLIDHLGPRYLQRVIRVDPWHKPYEYEGVRDRFILRSAGADGKAKTADDIIIQRMSDGERR